MTWKLRAVHSAACEEVCDAVAADYIGGTEAYSCTLARLALDMRAVQFAGAIPAGVIPMARTAEVIQRLQILKQRFYPQALAKHWCVLCLVLVSLGLLLFGGLNLVQAEADTGPTLEVSSDSESSITSSPPQLGMDAPPFTATTLNGDNLSNRDFKGKVTAIVFWASWCGPCKPLMASLDACYKKYHRSGFDVVAFSLDEDPNALAACLKKQSYPWQHNIRIGSVDHPIARTYQVKNLPSSFLLNKEGEIRSLRLPIEHERYSGPKLEELVSAVLNEQTSPKNFHFKGAVGGAVVRNGKLAEIDAQLKRIDNNPNRFLGRNKTHATGSYTFQNIAPGQYQLKLSCGRMASAEGLLSLTKQVNILEDVQWHNFELQNGTSTLHFPRNNAYVMWLRQMEPHQGAQLDYAQYYYIKDGEREAYTFNNLSAGQYQYRLQWMRGDNVFVQGGQIDLDDDQIMELDIHAPQGTCKIEGTVQGIQKKLSDPIVFIRQASAQPLVYSWYYEMGTWDTVVLVRDRKLKKTGKFQCDGLSPGNYVVTVAQLQNRQYGSPIIQTSKPIQLTEESPDASLALELPETP